MKLLIVEDDDKLRTELARFFSGHGYETEEITDYENLEEAVWKAGGDLLLLDIGLPLTDGMFLCRSLRKKSSLPIVIITSQNTEMNELLCMNYGADDFIAKPFNPQILLAHVEAVLKRTNSHGQKEERIDCGGFWLDLSRGTVKDGVREIELTENETKHNYMVEKMSLLSSVDIISKNDNNKVIERDMINAIEEYLYQSKEEI